MPLPRTFSCFYLKFELDHPRGDADDNRALSICPSNMDPVYCIVYSVYEKFEEETNILKLHTACT